MRWVAQISLAVNNQSLAPVNTRTAFYGPVPGQSIHGNGTFAAFGHLEVDLIRARVSSIWANVRQSRWLRLD